MGQKCPHQTRYVCALPAQLLSASRFVTLSYRRTSKSLGLNPNIYVTMVMGDINGNKTWPYLQGIIELDTHVLLFPFYIIFRFWYQDYFSIIILVQSILSFSIPRIIFSCRITKYSKNEKNTQTNLTNTHAPTCIKTCKCVVSFLSNLCITF